MARNQRWLKWAGVALMVIPVWAAALGMQFSPSFTTAFVTAGVLLTGIGLLAALYARYAAGAAAGHRSARVISVVCMLTGLACSLPASFIYATGDDLLSLCVIAALLLGAAAGFCGTRTNPSAAAFLLAWFLWASALFTFLCGLRSPGLLPYGAGMLLQCAVYFSLSSSDVSAESDTPEEKSAQAAARGPAAGSRIRVGFPVSYVLAWLGTALSALFNIAPAIF